MQLCRSWGRDLSWWRTLTNDEQALYAAHWNLEQQELAQRRKGR